MPSFKLVSLPILLLLSAFSGAAPVPSKRANHITLKAYKDFQISSGTAGNALAQAKAIFVDPFKGVALKDISDADVAAMSTMRTAAEDAEATFIVEIDKVGQGSEAGKKLLNGMIKNKVLKLQGLTQIRAIRLAKRPSDKQVASALADTQNKLTKNAATDKEHAGQASTPVNFVEKGSAQNGVAANNAAAAKPAPAAAAAPSKGNRIVQKKYADFQISSSNAGNALAEAKAIFVDPFKGVALKDISDDDVAAMGVMRFDAELAEAVFVAEIDKVGQSSAAGKKLLNGMIKNKVLKLQGLTQLREIKFAKNPSDGSNVADLAETKDKLEKNAATDKQHAGEATTAVIFLGQGNSQNGVLTGGNGNAAAVAAQPKPAAPAPAKVAAVAAPSKGNRIVQKKYKDFQISSGKAGNALAEAKAIFVDPFNGIDLATVSQADRDAMSQMRIDAESAETDFNNAIAAAGGKNTGAGKLLQNGKIKNKVLKLQGLAQLRTIQSLQKPDDAQNKAALADTLKKLAANIKQDEAHKGQGSTPVV